MPVRFATIILMGLLFAACASPMHLEPRNGYIVDHRYEALSHNSRIRHLVIHYTDTDEAESLATLTGLHVSAHYVLPKPARHYHRHPLIYQLVDESRRAWHAGVSTWKGRPNINDTSIGIEIVNSGSDRPFSEVERLLETDPEATIDLHWAPYSESQIETLIALARDIIERHEIHPTDVLAHSDIAPARKIDPGPAFPWQRLYEAGIGVWPDETTVTRYRVAFEYCPPRLETLQHALQAWGYPLTVTGELDRQTTTVLRAFQMRFRPADYRGLPDADSAAILWALLDKYQSEAVSELQPPACRATALPSGREANPFIHGTATGRFHDTDPTLTPHVQGGRRQGRSPGSRTPVADGIGGCAPPC
ncbi:N-acetylmuramoyl-L-alanine amidase [Litchfieldella qijiaojingensis]|uniref:N-acetylmuramoyl-L-alanine amidase n=1 Tax=Litchfieldella qijiaojingensis TaxID=980347 RepID=A0ABQ2YET5_9GAMM|nr:N-acetylmuramoyl-L-alanine amidase [Halomonas qijiaojingensis]GGX80878.1 N-acetylmuramoyl-L-alanine amidase [Halomonas qijiaojingensis]